MKNIMNKIYLFVKYHEITHTIQRWGWTASNFMWEQNPWWLVTFAVELCNYVGNTSFLGTGSPGTAKSANQNTETSATGNSTNQNSASSNTGELANQNSASADTEESANQNSVSTHAATGDQRDSAVEGATSNSSKATSSATSNIGANSTSSQSKDRNWLELE